jgi:hypothetical protein
LVCCNELGVDTNPGQIQANCISGANDCRIAIFDVTGQLVGVRFEGQHVAGIISLLWNGTDSNGAPVFPGVYVVVVAVDGRVVDMMKVIKYPLLQ